MSGIRNIEPAKWQEVWDIIDTDVKWLEECEFLHAGDTENELVSDAVERSIRKSTDDLHANLCKYLGTDKEDGSHMKMDLSLVTGFLIVQYFEMAAIMMPNTVRNLFSKLATMMFSIGMAYGIHWEQNKEGYNNET